MSLNKINTAILGATGFVGLDLVLILSNHKHVNIKYLCAQRNIGKEINLFDNRIKKKLPKISGHKKIIWKNVDLVFLSLPNREAQKIIKKNIKYKHLKFIDLAADFRLKNSYNYKKWYGQKHLAPHLIKSSIYSIAEFVKEKIKKYKIISNPGCYPTSIQLPLIPLVSNNLINTNNIIIDSKSGYSGAGKNYKKKFTHKNFEESIFAYGVNSHRHMSELDEQLKLNSKMKIKYIFKPHLIPTFRGILSTIHLELKKGVSIKKVYNFLIKFHKNNKFIKILKMNKAIGTGDVINTNYCFISICKTTVKGKIVIYSVIDNLIKGASGQAVQNMNLMYDFDETTGLI
jgi:N-acetyl-gamma-glutamyl-phosphate reductase